MTVQLIAHRGPVDPSQFADPAAAATFLARHRGCYVQVHTLTEYRIERTDQDCAHTHEHQDFPAHDW